jgi:gliding motility-associated-like protein
LPHKALISLLAGVLFTLQLVAQETYNNLEFIENKGQWHADVLYKSDLRNGAFFLRNGGFTVIQHHPDDLKRIADRLHGHLQSSDNKTLPFTHEGFKRKAGSSYIDSNTEVRSHAYRMDFINANPHAKPMAEKPAQDYVNYFIGDDSTKWASNCHIFQEVIYKNIYPGIDVKYYTEAGNPKYEFIVSAGADPSQIAMKFEGVDKLSLRGNELIITTAAGEVKELAPYTYQADINGRRKIDCRYKLEKGNIVRFAIKNYVADQPLIIDPTLVFASLSGSTADNWGYTATYGPDGSFFAGGIVFDNGYRVSTGAYKTSFQGGRFDMGIMKLSSNGSQRLYATYIGGNGEDQPHSLFCDPQGNLVIAGRTNSANYPATATFGSLGGYDIVVTKLNAGGTNIIGSVRIGGTGNDGFNIRDSHQNGPSELVNNYGDDARSEVILDGANNIYVASCTQSADFYTTGNAVQATFQGAQDAVLLKLNSNCNAVLYSSYFGGSGYDAGFVLALNPTNADIYMAGATTSPIGTGANADIPGSKAGVIQPANAGGRTDGFIAVFSNDGSVLRRSTYLGTNGVDFIYGIQFDKKGYPYVMGTTTGSWPVINAAYSVSGSKQFVGKLNPDLSGWQYSTTFGTTASTPNISPVAFLVDRCENVYISGWGKDLGGKYTQSGTLGMYVSNDAIQKNTDNHDFYFIVLKRDVTQVLYATFFGQNGGLGEHVDGGTSRYDQNGVIYQAICANCYGGSAAKPRWPVSPGAWCCSSGYAAATVGGGCNLGAVKIAFNYAGVGSSVKSLIDGKLDSTGCIPLTVNLRDTIRNAKSYEWDFNGDGVTDVVTTNNDITHTYPLVGNYRVRLIAVDSSTCNIRDTSYVTIIARDNKANLAWSYFKTIPCPDLSLGYTFVNSSTATKPFADTSFIWDFGDGTRTAPQGLLPNQSHTFAAPGVYPVRLVLNDTSYCNFPDSLEVMLRVSPLVKAQFETPATGCAPYEAIFNNTSLGGEIFTWDFGDGSPTSNDINPTHWYANPGSYTISLHAVDNNTCNVTHDTTFTITVYAPPAASFTYTPIPPIENTPNIFTNTSSPDAIRFSWSLGDSPDSVRTTSRAPIQHQYDETFTYNVCLVAYNQPGCADTACQQVSVIVSPRLDVPNAFTPTQNNNANKIYIRGFAIGKMHFTIYNRLGQKVFETTDKNQGWDGRFKGVMQPMDAYGYTLEVEFTDGTRATKKGDITLIR